MLGHRTTVGTWLCERHSRPLAGSTAGALARCMTCTLLAMALVSVALPPVARAQTPPAPVVPQDNEAASKAKLDALFLALRKAQSDAEAAEFVAEIWRQWMISGKREVDVLMQRAIEGMQARDFGLASLLLDEVVEQAPEFAEGWNRRATLRYMMGDHKGSLADIEKTLALEPRHFGALAGRGLIYIAAEDWQSALEAYRAAVAINPYLVERNRVLPELEKRVDGNKL